MLFRSIVDPRGQLHDQPVPLDKGCVALGERHPHPGDLLNQLLMQRRPRHPTSITSHTTDSTRRADQVPEQLHWLYYWLSSPVTYDEFQLIAGARNGLTKGMLREVQLPLPSVKEQRRIVDILEGHLCRLDAAERDLAAADERVNMLHMALLATGLRGQLVPELPTW